MKSYDPTAPQEVLVECSICGRDGGPLSSCTTCHGAAGTQERAYSLSDIRAGRVSIEVLNNGREPGSAPREYQNPEGGSK